MNHNDMEEKLTELRKELMKFNSQIAVGTVPKNPGKIEDIKRTIAKILTISKEHKGGSKTE